jgi:outer membrane protein
MTAPTRDHILAAAARLYGEHGFRGTTTRRIAEEAGVNEVTLFRLFGTKTALLLEALRTHGTTLESAALPAVPRDPLQELTDWCAHKRRSISHMRSIIRKAMSEYEENPAMPKCMTHGASQTYQMLRGYIERLAKAGFIKSDADGTAATAMLMSALFHDAIARDIMPIGFPQPSSAAPGIYARLCLRSLGYDPAAAKHAANARRRKITAAALLLLLGTLLAPVRATAQQPAAGVAPAPREISLADALQLAARVSHSVRTSEAGVLRARGQEFGARAQYLPQINGSFSYQRIIESQFQAISKQSSSGNTSSGGKDTSSNNLANSAIAKIFAAPNTAILGLTLSQNLFTAGRLTAASRGAEAARTSAEIGLDAARAQVALDVAQAYYDAVAGEQLVQIADSTLAQTERTLKQIEVSKSVGSSAEFDVLRARVARDNQRPVAIQALGNRDVAFLRLRQLLGIPLNQPLTLTTPIRDEGVAPAEPRAIDLTVPIAIPGAARGTVPDTSVGHRSSVRQAEANVTAQDYALRAQKWNRLPTLQLSSNYQRFAYPPDGTFLPNSFAAYYPNWTASLGIAFPVFSGGRLEGDRMTAEANLVEARQSYEQVKEFAALDARTALNQLEQAQAGYAASVGTDAQAARAYAIAEVRFAEGISTQVELQQSRTQYEQARLNRVLAARDLEVARLRVALLKDLPVSGATAAAARR